MPRGMTGTRRIRWYRTMVFKLTALVSVSILIFSLLTIILMKQRNRGLYSYESIDRKIKISVALERSLKDMIVGEWAEWIGGMISDFISRNYDVAYFCVKAPGGVLLSSSGKRECPEYPRRKELTAYRTDGVRVYQVRAEKGDVNYTEIVVFLSPEKHKYGSVTLGFYEMDAIAAERFRKIISLENHMASNVARWISEFSFGDIDNAARDMTGRETNIRYMIVTNDTFQVISHPDQKQKFNRLTDAVSKQTEKTGHYTPFMMQNTKMGSEEIMDVAMGLFDGNKRLGGIRIGYSLSSEKQRVFRSAVKLIAIALALACIGLAISIVLARRIAAPVLSLSAIALKVGGGDLDTKAVYRTGGDEIRFLYESFNQMIAGLKERDLVKDTFSRYVTKQVADEILKDPTKIAMGGKKQDVTILFSDIRGFTTFSESHTPEEVISHLNEYLSAMVDVIFKYEGTLDKYIGDAIMAVFGSPLSHDDDPLRAVKTALEMQERLNELNKRWKEENRDLLKIGIGINTGEVIAGNIGDIRRMEYTVIGDNVNLASRIEGLTKNYDCPIIISESTYENVQGQVEVKKLEATMVKGKSHAVEIYELLGLKS